MVRCDGRDFFFALFFRGFVDLFEIRETDELPSFIDASILSTIRVYA